MEARRRVKRIWKLIAGVLLVTPLIGAARSPVSPSSTAGCHPLKVARTYGRTSNGHLVTAGTRGSATIQEYTDGESVTQPPDGFVPANASPEALRAFLIDPALRNSAVPLNAEPLTPPCVNPARNNATNQDGENWAGRAVAYHTFTFTDIQARWVVPHYDHSSYCLKRSEASIWVGIGGDYTDRLIQAGVQTYAGGDTDVNFFYENDPVSGGSHNVGTPAITNGQQAQAHVNYSPANGIAYAYLTNLTTSATATYALPSAGSDYDGQSGEFIVERPVDNGTLDLMRRSTDTYDPYWNSEYINGVSAGAYAPGTQYSITMRDNPGDIDYQGPDVPMQTTVLGNTTTQSNTWNNCGPEPNDRLE